MSIKPVEKLPTPPRKGPKSYREMIRDDFNEAIEKRIARFEFEGDYNYKYLQQYARQVADWWIFKGQVYKPAEEKVKAKLKKKYPNEKYIFCKDVWSYRRKYIQVTSIKKEDRIHVYAEIDFEYGDNFYKTLLKDTEESLLKAIERRQEKEARGDQG